MIQRMKELIRSRDLCVLATTSGGRPHCSLMAYVTDDDCAVLYMTTLKDSTKYANLVRNPEVSLLVDTRDSPEPDGGTGIRALTVSGRYEPPEAEDEERRARTALLERHPGLEPLLRDENAAVIRIRMKTLLLLDGPQEAHFETL